MANEPYQPINISTGSAQQAIQSTPNATPALGDLMSSIKEGFISADDIRRRVQSGPLEAATNAANLTDVQQVRPLQTQAQVAELQNVQAKQQFEAETLPILNDVKRATLAQAFDNAKQFGAPEEILKVFYASVPNFIPFDPEKLHDKKTGQVNLPYAIEMIQKAHIAADKIKKLSALKPTTITDVSPTGTKSTFEQLIDPVSGALLGAKVPTGVQQANTVEAEQKATAAAAGLSNDVLKERNSSDIIKRYIPQAGAFQAIDEIRYRSTPPTNADDLAILYEVVKVLDPTSVVREGEKKFAESTASGIQELYNKVQGVWSSSNKTIDAATRANLYATMDSLRAASEKQTIPELKRISLLAIDRNMPLAQAMTEPELKLLINGPTVLGKPAPTVPGVAPVAAIPTGENPVVTVEQARTLPPTVKYFRLVAGGPLKWNSNHPDSPAQKRLLAAPPAGDYGKRQDGTAKGLGYFGELKRPDGDISTELSIGVNFDGQERQIPSLVPTLTPEEINSLLNGGAPTKAIIDKAVSHARQRIKQGESPFARAGEQISPPPLRP